MIQVPGSQGRPHHPPGLPLQPGGDPPDDGGDGGDSGEIQKTMMVMSP